MNDDRAPRVPGKLGTAGAAFWRDTVAVHTKLDVVQLRLLEEACRIWDRLSRLNAVLTGDASSLLTLDLPDDGGEIALNVSSALAEARLQATVFKQTVVAMRLPDSAGKRPQRRGARGAYQTSGGTGSVSALDRMRKKSSG